MKLGLDVRVVLWFSVVFYGGEAIDLLDHVPLDRVFNLGFGLLAALTCLAREIERRP